MKLEIVLKRKNAKTQMFQNFTLFFSVNTFFFRQVYLKILLLVIMYFLFLCFDVADHGIDP